MRRWFRILRSRCSRLGLALAAGLMLTSCSNDVATETLGPAPHRDADQQDLIMQALSQIENSCSWLYYVLNTLYMNGDLRFDDVYGQFNDRAYAPGDGSILLEQTYYNSGNLGQLVLDIMHEAGHAVGGYPDYPGSCGNLYDCEHWNPYDDGCPPEGGVQLRAKPIALAAGLRLLDVAASGRCRRGVRGDARFTPYANHGGIA